MAKTDWHIDSDPVKPEDMNQIGQEINENRKNIEKHSSDKNNPHGVTKAQVGLSNVDNVKQATKAEFNEINKEVKEFKAKLDLLEIGGRNLLLNTSFDNEGANWSGIVDIIPNAHEGKAGAVNERSGYTGIARRFLHQRNTDRLVLTPSKTYTFSGWFYIDSKIPLDEKNNSIFVRKYQTSERDKFVDIATTIINLDDYEYDKWYYFEDTDSVPDGYVGSEEITVAIAKNGRIIVSELKLEKGNKATDWTPAPEDVETPEGAQEKADKALLEAKKYMDLHAQMHKVTDDNGEALTIPEGSDLNNITKTGFYKGRNLINQPSKNFTWFYYTVLQQNTFECVQYATAFSKRAETYIRRSDGSGEFSEWQLFSASDLEWTTVPTLLNGWKTFLRPVQYIQIGNMVHFRGAVTDGLYFEPIFYMPTNLRPKQVYAIPCASIGTGSSNYTANRLQIETTGAVMIRFDGSIPSYSLDGACFAIN